MINDVLKSVNAIITPNYPVNEIPMPSNAKASIVYSVSRPM